jgi:hypothetical protein
MERARCLVYRCPNHKDEGVFVGDLCAPCHKMLTTGRIPKMRGETFIHRLVDDLTAALSKVLLQ